MKKILLLTLSNFEDIHKRGIYPDLVRTLSEKSEVFVVTPREKRTGLNTELSKFGNINILKVRTGNITKCKSFIEKGLSTLRIESQYLAAIQKYFPDVKFDMIMYSTPPITFIKIVDHFKQKQNSKTYLILKDIFPQNAVDINLIKKNGLLHKYFKKKETELYKISDHIGCMSKGNVNYLLAHNTWLDKDKVEVFPNAIIPIERREKNTKDLTVLDKYKIPHDSVIFIYGGNLGKPQGIDFLLQIIDNFYKVKNAFLLIVGSGTEFNRIEDHISDTKTDSVSLFKYLPKDEYDKLLAQADVGLIFLDKRFTIPNFPSRLTAYMENSIPIIAATDTVTDIKNVLKESNSGLWCESGDIEAFVLSAEKIAGNEQLRNEMGKNARNYLEDNYDVRKSVRSIVNKL